jgi:TRAP-type C4-dicarboxylate transport system substrate-binding protein
VYTSLQTGVIDGYEHDASTTLQQRFFEVARHMTRTRHIAGVLGLFASSVGLARLPAGLRPLLEAAALEAAARERALGDHEDKVAAERLVAQGMKIRDIDRGSFLRAAEGLWQTQALALDVAPWLRAALR